MENNHFGKQKRILVTQLLSLIFAILGDIHIGILIKNDWMFDSEILFYIQIIILTILYIVLIIKFLDGKWINTILISIPYIIYWFLVFYYGSKIFPTNTDSEDYGIGLMGVFMSFYQWISIIIASIIGTYIKRMNN